MTEPLRPDALYVRIGKDDQVELCNDLIVDMRVGWQRLDHIRLTGPFDDRGLAPCVVVGQDGLEVEETITVGLWEQLDPEFKREGAPA